VESPDTLTPQSDLLVAGHEALDRRAWEEARRRFEQALDREESPKALEGLATAAWWLDDARATFEARERAYVLYRERESARDAARIATWLAWDYIAFRGDRAVANGWHQRARRLLRASSRVWSTCGSPCARLPSSSARTPGRPCG
jgi:hypothetical protein